MQLASEDSESTYGRSRRVTLRDWHCCCVCGSCNLHARIITMPFDNGNPGHYTMTFFHVYGKPIDVEWGHIRKMIIHGIRISTIAPFPQRLYNNSHYYSKTPIAKREVSRHTNDLTTSTTTTQPPPTLLGRVCWAHILAAATMIAIYITRVSQRATAVAACVELAWWWR